MKVDTQQTLAIASYPKPSLNPGPEQGAYFARSQQDSYQFSRQATQAAQATQANETSDSVRVSASTGQNKSRHSLTEQQAIRLYRKIAALL